MTDYVVILISGRLLDTLTLFFHQSDAVKEHDKLARKVWGNDSPSEFEDDTHNLYLTTAQVQV